MESTTLYANWEKIKEEDKKSNNVTDNKIQPVTYYCDSDFTLSDKKCIKVDTVKANGKCPIGYKVEHGIVSIFTMKWILIIIVMIMVVIKAVMQY